MKFDVCVIGAGPAGISVVSQLLRHSNKIIALVEGGGSQFSPHAQALLAGRVSRNHPPLDSVRMARFGGASAVWAGWSRPLEPIDMEFAPPRSLPVWPIDYSELQPHFTTAADLCGIDSFCFDPAFLENGFSKRALAVQGYLEERVFVVNPVDFASRLKTDSEKLKIYRRTTALELLSNDGKVISGVKTRNSDNTTEILRARCYILAAGGIENARCLLLSKADSGAVIGNQHAQVGRYYHEHGFVNSSRFYPSMTSVDLAPYFPRSHPDNPMQGDVRLVLSMSRMQMEKHRLLNCGFYFRPAYENHPVFNTLAVKSALELWDMVRSRAVPVRKGLHLRATLSRPDQVLHALLRKAFIRGYQHASWATRCYFESKPSFENRVQLTNELDDLGRQKAEVIWSFSDEDLMNVERFHRIVNEHLQRNKLGHLQYLSGVEAWRQAAETGKHLLGATRMSTLPEEGVVDKNLKVHGTQNLYIVGSSVFPSSGYVNPTLTIVALACRLAQYLAKKSLN